MEIQQRVAPQQPTSMKPLMAQKLPVMEFGAPVQEPIVFLVAHIIEIGK